MLSESFLWQAGILGVGLMCAAIVKAKKPISAKGVLDDAIGAIGLVLFFAMLTSGNGCSSGQRAHSEADEPSCTASHQGSICE